jgi:NADPH:quinone reductase-like Zn-dependent oxidoreductase
MELLAVTGANGGVGTAAIQIGLAKGGRVLAIARREEARSRIAALYGVDVAAPDAYVETATRRGGANVVVELLGQASVGDSLKALADQGRIVVVGALTGWEMNLNLRLLCRKRAVLRGTVLRFRSPEEKAAAVGAFTSEVAPWLAEGRMKPLIDRVFPMDRARDAFEYLAAPGKFGKVLIDLA